MHLAKKGVKECDWMREAKYAMQAIVDVFVEPFILHTHCGIEKQANKLITKPYCISALGCALRSTSSSENLPSPKIVLSKAFDDISP